MSDFEDFNWEGDEPDWVPTATVILSCTSERQDEDAVEFLDVHEDLSGRDVMVFVCPECGETHESLIYA